MVENCCDINRGTMFSNEENPSPLLRIASLLPSATEICGALGLAEHVKGITHECDVLFTPNIINSEYKYSSIQDALSQNAVRVVTTSEINPHVLDQGTIDRMVKESLAQQVSLYSVKQDTFDEIKPNIIITQQLCDVCAPSMRDVNEAIAAAKNSEIKILSLEPTSLLQVAETFVAVAKACDVEERGVQLKSHFLENLSLLQSKIQIQSAINNKDRESVLLQPKVLLLEWLDPPFDAGHWIPEMITYAGCCSALNDKIALSCNQEDEATQNLQQHQSLYNHKKSRQISWEDVYKADPDCVLIACCGFDMERNTADARKMHYRLSQLRAYHTNRIYACDGNRYFARPGPSLLQGCFIVARVAFDTPAGDSIIRCLEKELPFSAPKQSWRRVDFEKHSPAIPDIENLVVHDDPNTPDFFPAHNSACSNKESFYLDPETGFHVFTQYALRQRGRCCGSGCRHCPYNHENVKDKAAKIQQPAFLHEEWIVNNEERSSLFSLSSANGTTKRTDQEMKVLFYSGGKDSFLAMRALALDCITTPSARFSLVLLTTFDATSRIIAHQDIHIDIIVRQAKHLKISLVGVPLHRTTSETYVQRIQQALEMIEEKTGKKPSDLVFGDLHLDHIRHWRDTSLGLNWRLEYPLWKVPYEILLNDLEKSGVVFSISASERESIQVGSVYSRNFIHGISPSTEIDIMGENGEFHTVAQVWTVTRERALGIGCV